MVIVENSVLKICSKFTAEHTYRNAFSKNTSKALVLWLLEIQYRNTLLLLSFFCSRHTCLKYNTVNNTACILTQSLPTLITFITEFSNCYDSFSNCVKSA